MIENDALIGDMIRTHHVLGCVLEAKDDRLGLRVADDNHECVGLLQRHHLRAPSCKHITRHWQYKCTSTSLSSRFKKSAVWSSTLRIWSDDDWSDSKSWSALEINTIVRQ